MSIGSIPASYDQITCHACDGTWTGAWAEVQRLGWKRHSYGIYPNQRDFVMCGDCEHEYEQRRNAA